MSVFVSEGRMCHRNEIEVMTNTCTMKTTPRLSVILIIAFMLGARLQAAPVESPPRLLVKWNGGPNSPAATAGNAQIGATVKRNFSTLGWQLIELLPGMSATEGVAAYQALRTVIAVEPDGAMRVESPLPPSTNSPAQRFALQSLTPNDPRYNSQWYLPRIGAPAAWDITTGNSNVVVVIFDTGVDYTHPDLAPNMWRNPGETGLDDQGHDKATNGIDDDGNGYVDDVYGIDVLNDTGDPMDVGVWETPTWPATNALFHGTLIAGLIGAVGNNGVGIAGLNWSVRIMAIRHLGGDGAVPITNFWSSHLAAWDYMLGMKRRGVNIRVANHSYGGALQNGAVREAIAMAGDEGILSVCGAGNNAANGDLFSLLPASFNLPSIISVAATTESDALASFATFGASTVDLAAPGVNIISTSKGSNYMTASGTSFSAPLVGAAAALLLAVNPDLTVDELRAALLGSVDQPASLRGKVTTNGRLNVARALEYLTNANPPAIVITALPAGQRTLTNAPIHVTFNRPMNRASVENAFSIQPPIAGVFAWTNEDRSFAFHHDTPFDSATNYVVRIAGTAQDAVGGTLDGDFDRIREGSQADDFVWTFRFPIPNDDFASAQWLTGASGSLQASNRYAFLELDEPAHVLGDGRYLGASVWYRWTPLQSGWFTFDLTSGTAFDSMLAVYVGDRIDRLASVGGNDNYGNSTNSRVSFSAETGTIYSIVVLGKSQVDPNQAGNFNLRWYPTPAPFITSFAPATAYGGQQITLNGTNFTGATRVLFNGVPATFTFSTNAALADLQLTAIVPMGATPGPITVETPHGNFTTSSNFNALILPTLAIRTLPGNLVEVSWPSTPNFSFQRADSLSATSIWTNAATISARLVNGIRYVTVTNAVPNRFFRLYRP
jgi:subtilisin family serine protease